MSGITRQAIDRLKNSIIDRAPDMIAAIKAADENKKSLDPIMEKILLASKNSTKTNDLLNNISNNNMRPLFTESDTAYAMARNVNKDTMINKDGQDDELER